MAPQRTSHLPVEVELALDVMPCQAMRRSYDSAAQPHPCAYFAEWGVYHSYDYARSGPPEQPTTALPAVYAAKRPLIPELLSGCRKSPILCVGINPNLPGWTASTRSAIHPYFADVLQYAHYFRYRTRDKLRIPAPTYEALRGGAPEGPRTVRPLATDGEAIEVERMPVLMYEQYQTLLDGLAHRKQWRNHKLTVGEDIAYANMVACPSARWVVAPSTEDPDMPSMGTARAKGIVGECFYKRKHFLRQLFQSLPAVIIVFSQTTAREFIGALASRFSRGAPGPNEPLARLFEREIRLRYGTAPDGTELDARVIFMPHASARPAEFGQLREPCIDRLVEEVDRGHLTFHPGTGHLRRGRGGCVFCSNSLYRIGPCDYEGELRPLAAGTVEPLDAAATTALGAPAERTIQESLLAAFLQPMLPPHRTVVELLDADAALTTAAVPPPLILRGQVVAMTGSVLDAGAIYIREGRIVAVRPALEAAPAGFEHAPVVETGGVIYPGLLDLHNHLAYNVLPLWAPPRKFDNRLQWRARREYRRDISEPMSTLTRGGDRILEALIRYIEVKLLLGGVTSGQGMKSRFGGNRLYRGLVRNFEAPDDPALPRAQSRIPDLEVSDVASFRDDLSSGRPIYFHLAEGVDTEAHNQYVLLRRHALLRPNLLGIHSLGLQEPDFAGMRQAGARVVWSPLSNSILYGSTINPKMLLDSNVLFGLGSDWTPSGSRNLLLELKTAWLWGSHSGAAMTYERLAHAVTRDAARASHWYPQLGTIEAGKLADLLVLERRSGDPYANLIQATEANVRLVVVGGWPRYGDAEVMQTTAVSAADLEALIVSGRPKSLYLTQPGSPLDGTTFAGARRRLKDALSNLDGLRQNPAPLFHPLGAEPQLEIELDMQFESAIPVAEALAALPPLSSVQLDEATIVDDAAYFDRLEAVPHLPPFLKGGEGLRGFYS